MHNLTCGISSHLHSVNLIQFTLLLVHLILRISPYHSHLIRSHQLSLHRQSRVKTHLFHKSFPVVYSDSYSFRTALADLNLY